MQIDTERNALDHVPLSDLVQWANRYGLELVGNTRGGMTLRRQRPIVQKQESTDEL